MGSRQNIGIRLTPADAANVNAIANALRTDTAPFITRSAVIKLALAAVAADPQRFVGTPPIDMEGQRRAALRTPSGRLKVGRKVRR